MICFQAKNCNSKYSKYGKKKASGKDLVWVLSEFWV